MGNGLKGASPQVQAFNSPLPKAVNQWGRPNPGASAKPSQAPQRRVAVTATLQALTSRQKWNF